MNADLTYAVCLNLAIQHQHNGNDQEAMAIYYVCSNSELELFFLMAT